MTARRAPSVAIRKLREAFRRLSTIEDQVVLMAGVLRTLARGVVEEEDKVSPSKTPRQKRTMAAAAHDKDFAKKMGIPQKVAKEFNKADAAKHKPSAGKGKRK